MGIFSDETLFILLVTLLYSKKRYFLSQFLSRTGSDLASQLAEENISEIVDDLERLDEMRR
ncbi:hypothetical protein [Cytobacillus sp. IB215665]|uniref:hypothetical protein n=1 Tax=Cytobacillus sp. IB215665 TaxID=3097357 RepID=UPI002A177571|nr:hypothetical protein [Cytobacillus sp. IB215665]MDX8365479.1 hypothetical protein [Cytobacillus sp. IB215665]